MKLLPLLTFLIAALVFPGPTPTHAAPCAAGYFSIDGQDPCTPCIAGTFSDSPGATACTDCAPHTSSVEAATTCDDCPFFHYQPEAGSASCVRRNSWSCWTVKDLKNPAAFERVDDLAVSDEISAEPASLLKPKVICGSAGIESRPPAPNNDAKMCCYKSKGPRPEFPVTLSWDSQLSQPLQVRVVKPDLLCHQCQDPGSGPTEHPLQCWKVKDLKNPRFDIIHDLRVVDPWDFDFLQVKKPAYFCAPASVDGSPLLDVNGQTCCYRAGKAFRSTAIESVTDLFGNPLEFAVKRRNLLCEPCETSLVP